MMSSDVPHIEVKDLDMFYDDYLVMKDISFKVEKGEVFFIIGRSGCGKSTLLKHLIGLRDPERGKVFYNDEDFAEAEPSEKASILKKFGILYQGGALWSFLTLAENVALPLEEHTGLRAKDICELVLYKLSLVGLNGYEGFYPAEISGGMRKRAGLARAMALDPEILFFDEPSSGLDPVSSKRLDHLILQLRDSLGATVVVVSHELSSIFDIADNAIFLDSETKTIGAYGSPNDLLKEKDKKNLMKFLNREA